MERREEERRGKGGKGGKESDVWGPALRHQLTPCIRTHTGYV